MTTPNKILVVGIGAQSLAKSLAAMSCGTSIEAIEMLGPLAPETSTEFKLSFSEFNIQKAPPLEVDLKPAKRVAWYAPVAGQRRRKK